jgi:hypothetical protein
MFIQYLVYFIDCNNNILCLGIKKQTEKTRKTILNKWDICLLFSNICYTLHSRDEGVNS